ncbi:MAG: hypothetical protein GYB64_03830 [Chloroflexi bacterium]|nr:hypothetical protein [Chloroflexota bacterium]
MQERTAAWLLLLLALIAGGAGGFYYAWNLNPLTVVNVGPDRLTEADREVYILLVSEAYLHDGDLGRAQARLQLLGEGDLVQLVSVRADSAYLSGADPDEIRALTTLAEALGGNPLAADVFTGTLAPPFTPTPTARIEVELSPTLPEPTATPTVFVPTVTPTQAVTTTYTLIGREEVCQAEGAGLIEVLVLNEGGSGVPAVPVLARWEGGQNRFFTGLKPDQGSGYADFQTTPDRIYSIELVGLSQPVVGLSSFACTDDTGQIGTPVYTLVFAPLTEE